MQNGELGQAVQETAENIIELSKTVNDGIKEEIHDKAPEAMGTIQSTLNQTFSFIKKTYGQIGDKVSGWLKKI